ncbi:MAG TPA: DUF2997 domain-containing protein [Candidatus Tectomicrobia bacterium]|nr:DUF2997 domain-containing protein [Candidatus Tectomicrobia bacterium]
MVLKREMEIEIGRDGKVNIKVKGVQGADCLEFSQFLEEALGEPLEQELTSEYYQVPASTETTVQQTRQ